MGVSNVLVTVLTVLTLAGGVAQAQSSSSTAPSVGTSTAPAGKYSNSWTAEPTAGVKSYNDTARIGSMDDPQGRFFKSKQEMYVGAKLQGWSATAMAVQTGHGYNDSTKNRWTAGDPSLTIAHPDIYNGGGVHVFGQYRQYFPVSDFSHDHGTYHMAYYSFATAKIGSENDLFNQLTPRYFLQSRYDDKNSLFYLEDRTTISRKLSSWSRVGIGQWSQYETHAKDPAGFCTEIYPYADFIVNSHIYFGPRVSFPILARNSVYEGPSMVALSNAMAEFYFQAVL
jgi:hypothetical protein